MRSTPLRPSTSLSCQSDICTGIYVFHPTIPGYPKARFPGVVVFSEIYQGMLCRCYQHSSRAGSNASLQSRGPWRGLLARLRARAISVRLLQATMSLLDRSPCSTMQRTRTRAMRGRSARYVIFDMVQAPNMISPARYQLLIYHMYHAGYTWISPYDPESGSIFFGAHHAGKGDPFVREPRLKSSRIETGCLR